MSSSPANELPREWWTLTAELDAVTIQRDGALVQRMHELAEQLPKADELQLQRKRVWARLSAEMEQAPGAAATPAA
ncbi:MAG: hypothetical protein V3V06_08770 [Dehalococcoidia bacterium]